MPALAPTTLRGSGLRPSSWASQAGTLFCLAMLCATVHASPGIGNCATPDDIELARLVNEYRTANGLPSLPVSHWLSATAQYKIWDRINNPSAYTGGCSTHSWSANPPFNVTWSPVCWTGVQSVEMWRKPFEISGGRYAGNGYELTADAGVQTPAQALAQWQASPAHNTVILNQGPWAAVPFSNLGVSLAGSYAVLWFGDAPDPDGAMMPCDADYILSDGFEASA